MKFFDLLKNLDALAVLIFIVSVLLVTEGFKFLFKKKEWYGSVTSGMPNLFPLMLSWGSGAIIFLLIHVFSKTFFVTALSILQFSLLLALLNGGYKILKPVIVGWVTLMTKWLKKNGDGGGNP